MSGLTYDSGALIAGERNDRILWALHRAALVRGITPTVPTGVLAEVWRGGPQHHLSRLLKGCRPEPFGEAQARAVGVLIGRSDVHDT
ncbi:MAG: twitching motility protein PilT, partial [Vicinamibacterales bacterium]